MPVEMWKTDLIQCEYYLYISTGTVENLWITLLPVDNFDRKRLFASFPQAVNIAACGNVEKTCLIITNRRDN